MAQILSGKPVAEALKTELLTRSHALQAKGVQPTLAVFRLGDDPADGNYIQSIRRRAEAVGVTLREVNLPADEDSAIILAAMENLAADPTVHGILMCQPLPRAVRSLTEALLARLPAEKDVDGATAASAAALFLGQGEGYHPCTAAACMKMLDFYGIECRGKTAAVIGRSAVIGKPAAMLLLNKNATVTICHTKTADLAAVCRASDIVLASAGCARLVGAEHVKEGAVVLDVGANWDAEAGKIVGDVRFDEVEPLAGAISPVPGGIGMVTASILMEHVISAAENA